MKGIKPHNFTSEAKNTIINNSIACKDELGEVYAQELQ